MRKLNFYENSNDVENNNKTMINPDNPKACLKNYNDILSQE